MALEFMVRTLDGQMLAKGDPEYALRERFSQQRNAHFTRIFGLAICVKAANAKILGKRVGLLRMVENENFPEFVGGGLAP